MFNLACGEMLGLQNMSRGTSAWRIVDYCLIIILAFSAGAKAWVLLSDDFASFKLGLPSPILYSAVLLETGLALLLLSKADPTVKVCSALLLLAVFSAVTMVRVFLGASSCSCYGVFEMTVSNSLLINLLLIAVLTARLLLDRQVSRSSPRRVILHWVYQNSTLLGAFLGVMLATAATASDFFSKPVSSLFQGSPPVVVENQLLGEVELGRKLVVPFDLKNEGDVNIEIVGAETSCDCFVADNYTRQLRAGTATRLTATLIPTTEGWFRQQLRIYLRSKQQPSVAVDFVGLAK